jgi:hypothetical protein
MLPDVEKVVLDPPPVDRIHSDRIARMKSRVLYRTSEVLYHFRTSLSLAIRALTLSHPKNQATVGYPNYLWNVAR